MEDNMKKRKREGGPTCRCGLKSDVQIYDFMEDEWVWWCQICDDEVALVKVEVEAEKYAVLLKACKSLIAHKHQGNFHAVDYQRIEQAIAKIER